MCVFGVGHFPTLMPKCADSQGEIPISFLGEIMQLGKKAAEEIRFGIFFPSFWNLVEVFLSGYELF